jgi:hypothetical protein
LQSDPFEHPRQIWGGGAKFDDTGDFKRRKSGRKEERKLVSKVGLHCERQASADDRKAWDCGVAHRKLDHRKAKRGELLIGLRFRSNIQAARLAFAVLGKGDVAIAGHGKA